MKSIQPVPRQGIALIITLIMLSIITVMTVAFLAVSQRNRSLVTTSTDQVTAKFMAETALARAQAEVAAQMASRSNLLGFSLMVSTNYVTTPGFNPDPGIGISQTNANYSTDVGALFDYRVSLGGGNYSEGNLAPSPALQPSENLQNLASLQYDPRPPVFVATNFNDPFAPREFRYYLDLNRNGKFEQSGRQRIIGPDGQIDAIIPGYNSAGVFQGSQDILTGDPQWIGVLEHPGYPHSSSNRFVGRYAYIAVPAGLTLDINAVHNYSKGIINGNVQMQNDGFLRNQGFGTWEVNLAGLLVGLNTNSWPGPNQTGIPGVDYFYDVDPTVDPNPNSNDGYAFRDALSILRYRYRTNEFFNTSSLNNLLSFNQIFPPPLTTLLVGSHIDPYSIGPLDASPTAPIYSGNVFDQQWPGSPNPTRLLSFDEFFSAQKMESPISPGTAPFIARLQLPGLSPTNTTYDRFTFYRLLSAIGSDSDSEPLSFQAGAGNDIDHRPDVYVPEDKININFDNLAPNNPSISAIDWDPLRFFTNAADRMLRAQNIRNSDGTLLSLTNIVVWPTNNYSSGVHRLLQVAANIVDATTNDLRTAAVGPGYPSVFRPLFARDGSRVIIAGYTNVSPDLDIVSSGFVDGSIYIDLNSSNAPTTIGATPDIYQVHGIPLVIGAKKGYPNFNELSVQTAVQAQRILQVSRPSTTAPPNRTNQFYVFGITNVFGLESWNSYNTNYSRDLELAVEVDFAMVLTNTAGQVIWPPQFGANPQPIVQTFRTNFVIGANAWQAKEFRVPLQTNVVFLTNSVWRSDRFPPFEPIRTNNIGIVINPPTTGFPVPDLQLSITNRVRYVLTDMDSGGRRRIVDYVNVDGLSDSMNLSSALLNQNNLTQDSSPAGRMWNTNRVNDSTDINDPTLGIVYQILASLGEASSGISENDWRSYSNLDVQGSDKEKRIDAFRNLFGMPPLFFDQNPVESIANVVQAGYTPTRKMLVERQFQVNDPLVHYTAGDLVDPAKTNFFEFIVPATSHIPEERSNIGKMNTRYRPWGGNPVKEGGETDQFANSPSVKDPLIAESDDWSFPTNKWPNLGWLGRVHRGTPWQTVYLKSADEGLTMRDWTLDWSANTLTYPTNDWRLVDLFTVGLNEKSTKGQLSVNNDELAAWSAVLSGMVALTNDPGTGSLEPLVVQPGSEEIFRIFQGIRTTRFSQPNRIFARKGDILSVPELSFHSPFIDRSRVNTNGVNIQDPRERTLNDVAYERIPQMMLSLLSLGHPKVVIYAYGQSLQPAPNSVSFDPDYYQMVTNYQITGEFVSRAVVRYENASDTTLTDTNGLPVTLPLKPVPRVESYSVLPPE